MGAKKNFVNHRDTEDAAVNALLFSLEPDGMVAKRDIAEGV